MRDASFLSVVYLGKLHARPGRLSWIRRPEGPTGGISIRWPWTDGPGIGFSPLGWRRFRKDSPARPGLVTSLS